MGVLYGCSDIETLYQVLVSLINESSSLIQILVSGKDLSNNIYLFLAFLLHLLLPSSYTADGKS